MRLSNNFFLHEFLVSQTAERHGIDMTPSEDIIYNIQTLVDTCMQPLREELGTSIFISSGYRPYALNVLIGGSKTSAHMDGRAADFVAAGYTPLEVCEIVVKLGLPFDQIIHEFGRWVHLGIAETPREQKLTAYRKDGKTAYTFGLYPMEDFV